MYSLSHRRARGLNVVLRVLAPKNVLQKEDDLGYVKYM